MKTPQNKVKDYFRKGGRLTVLKALAIFGTTELRSIVCRLRNDDKDPMNIVSRKKVVSASDGRRVEVKEYYCPDATPSTWFKIRETFRVTI